MSLLVLGTVAQACLLGAEVVECNQIVNELVVGSLENAELSHNLEEVGVLVGVHGHILQMGVLRLQTVSSVPDAVSPLLRRRVVLSIPHQVLRSVVYLTQFRLVRLKVTQHLH